MKTQRLTCPDCGAHLKVTQPRSFVFCEYCGTQIYIDDEVKRSEITINKNININQTINKKEVIEDKAKIAAEKSWTVSFVILCLMIMMGFVIVFLSDSSIGESIMANFFTKEEEPAIEYVVMPSSSYAYTCENYETVRNELTEAGFTNVVVVKDEPGLVGTILMRDGEVISVTIDDKNVDAGKEYPADAKIIIKYCYYK